MTPILLRTWRRAATLAARSEFPDADPRLFLGDAFRDVIRGQDEFEPVRASVAWSPYPEAA